MSHFASEQFASQQFASEHFGPGPGAGPGPGGPPEDTGAGAGYPVIIYKKEDKRLKPPRKKLKKQLTEAEINNDELLFDEYNEKLIEKTALSVNAKSISEIILDTELIKELRYINTLENSYKEDAQKLKAKYRKILLMLMMDEI